MNQKSPSGRRANVLGVHSIDHFAVEVPDLEAARTFYTLFGLEVRDRNGTLELYAAGNPHRWGVLSQSGDTKRLRYLSFGIYPDEMEAFAAHLDSCGVTRIDAPKCAETGGIWFAGFDGLPINVRAADKATPSEKAISLSPARRPANPAPFPTARRRRSTPAAFRISRSSRPT